MTNSTKKKNHPKTESVSDHLKRTHGESVARGMKNKREKENK